MFIMYKMFLSVRGMSVDLQLVLLKRRVSYSVNYQDSYMLARGR